MLRRTPAQIAQRRRRVRNAPEGDYAVLNASRKSSGVDSDLWTLGRSKRGGSQRGGNKKPGKTSAQPLHGNGLLMNSDRANTVAAKPCDEVHGE